MRMCKMQLKGDTETCCAVYQHACVPKAAYRGHRDLCISIRISTRKELKGEPKRKGNRSEDVTFIRPFCNYLLGWCFDPVQLQRITSGLSILSQAERKIMQKNKLNKMPLLYFFKSIVFPCLPIRPATLSRWGPL